MKIKNYTSEVPIDRSMGKIEKNLVSAGADKIMKSYDANGVCASISFTLFVDGKSLGFQLPSRVDKIYNRLIKEYTRPTPRSFELAAEQAGRTAWKIISDWVEIQITMITLDQADLLQVFMPYLHDGTESLYDKLKKSDFKLLS